MSNVEETTPPPTTTSGSRVGTGLAWGVKSSFVRYVTSMNGSVRLDGGAAVTRDGEYYFSLEDQSDFSAETLSGSLQFRGEAHFSGHSGLLNVGIVDPRLTMTADRAVLSAETGSGPKSRIDLVMLQPGEPTSVGEVLVWRSIPTWLSPGAAFLFNGAYGPSEAFDVLSFRILRES